MKYFYFHFTLIFFYYFIATFEDYFCYFLPYFRSADCLLLFADYFQFLYCFLRFVGYFLFVDYLMFFSHFPTLLFSIRKRFLHSISQHFFLSQPLNCYFLIPREMELVFHQPSLLCFLSRKLCSLFYSFYQNFQIL